MTGHVFSTLTFPAVFLSVLLNSALVSGISKGDKRMDCRRYDELVETKHHAKDIAKKKLTGHLNTMA